MSRGSIREYTEAVRLRYLWASKKEKGKILDEFTQVTRLHRKAAIRLLRRAKKPPSGRKRGRPRKYGAEAARALKVVWEAADRICSRRLHPFVGEMISVLKHHSELTLSPDIGTQLCQMSPSTMDRLLHPYRLRVKRRPFSTTRPGTLLKTSIPIRTFGELDRSHPGFLEADTVAHCEESAEGFYLTTLSMVDVATGWIECQGVWGKGQQRVGTAIHRVKTRLPFPLLGLHSDNGSEFINYGLYNYCQRYGIKFTRSRSYKKNDNAHVEQKNWSVVRRLVGYGRYNSHAALECLNHLYDLVRLYINFFQPTLKLRLKTRHGARVHKVYDEAHTPYHRLVVSGVLAGTEQGGLEQLYRSLNPVSLLRQINENLERLWDTAEHPINKQGEVKTYEASVT